MNQGQQSEGLDTGWSAIGAEDLLPSVGSPFKSQKSERAAIIRQLRAKGKTFVEIAETFRERYRVNARVALRYAHQLSQSEVAKEWCRRWPDDPRSAKGISPWEVWPEGGHAPTLTTLARLAEIYKCSVGDLLVDLPSYREQASLTAKPAERRPRPARQPHVALVTSELLPAVSSEHDPRDINTSGSEPEDSAEKVERREFIAWGASAVAASSFGGMLRGPKGFGPVEVSDVEPISRAAVRLRVLAHLHGGESLWRAALALASDGYLMLEQGEYDETTGTYLQQAIGRAEMCAGWLAFDAGHHEVARSSFNEALSLARQTFDPVIETHALVNLAYQSNFLGMPRQALRFADAADRVARDVLPKMEIVPQLRRASAYAAIGDESAAEFAMGRARELFSRDASKVSVEWCDFLSPAELNGVEGTCWLRLGNASKAERLLDLALDAHTDEYARNRALYRVRLATAQLDGSHVDAAAISANLAVQDVRNELVSAVVSTELDAIATRLFTHRGLPEVEAFFASYIELKSLSPKRKEVGA